MSRNPCCAASMRGVTFFLDADSGLLTLTLFFSRTRRTSCESNMSNMCLLRQTLLKLNITIKKKLLLMHS